MVQAQLGLPPPDVPWERRASVPTADTLSAKPPMPHRSASSPAPGEGSLDCEKTTLHDAIAPSNGLNEQSQVDAAAPTVGLLRPVSSAGRDDRTGKSEGDRIGLSAQQSVRSVPSIVLNDGASRPSSRWSERKWTGLKTKRSTEFDKTTAPPQPSLPVPSAPAEPAATAAFSGISLEIPTGFLDEMQTLQFSKRGSLIRKKPGAAQPQSKEEESTQSSTTSLTTKAQQESGIGVRRTEARSIGTSGSIRLRQRTIASRAISADEDMLSRRVRLMYEKGEENVSDTEVAKSMALENGVLWEETPLATSVGTPGSAPPAITTPEASGTQGPESNDKDQDNMNPSLKYLIREAEELGGGIEYWENVKAGDVDRYGFIRPLAGSAADGVEPNPIQRVTTSLLLASETPRRKRSIRPPRALTSNRSFGGRSPTRKASESSTRPTSSQSAYNPALRRSESRLRQAVNHLPYNRDRKVKDEAGDMLTLPNDFAGPADGVDTPATRAMRKKEWEREDKWTKMARPTRKTRDGGGMTFEFDTRSTKLIERTWKGIPDRWRATAWYAFLDASAKRHKDSPTEEELIEAFQEFQYISSPDDVQIDIDVPRTITSHIMFRRRYRGGQRLLFRVLHAMSLYFPDTGYVQGMAALAATLLAYYDEEHAFIMLVRLWQLRGLERLYRSGFSGLMEALNDFEREWLDGGEVAAKLEELGIPPTSYGTRWYLTLFNYSIPFAAQLRVWDVFMLLGDAEDITAPPPPLSSSSKENRTKSQKEKAATGPPSSFGRGLDVLHATSAALIDGMRDIILESDFENGMKVLTSWIPIKDVELFMRVAKTEWKVHRRKHLT